MTSDNSYNRIPYESYPFAQSHPQRLATIGTIFGLKPAPLQHCRVLELGCASGGNLIPMAEVFLDSTFLGIDASSRQIEDGNESITALGFGNITLKCEDLLNVDDAYGKFDYIIAHGVYSWVPDNVQQKIFSICKQNLSENGIAYISYNTYPGWRLRGMIRDLMLYRAKFFESPENQLRQGRALLDFLAEATSSQNNAFSKLLADEVQGLRTKHDYYLIHEHLEAINEPVYFYEFMERAESFGLKYLGEAEYSMMMASNFSKNIEQMVTELARSRRDGGASVADLPFHGTEMADGVDVIQLEQYMDFVRNRLFRQTLLCHEKATLNRQPDSAVVRNLFAATSSQPEAPITDLHSHERVVFHRSGSTLGTTDALLKAAMLELQSVWPQSIHFEDLIAAARGKVQHDAVIMDQATVTREIKRLTDPLLHCYATTHVDLCVQSPAYTTMISEKPQASRVSRYQAATHASVTNLRHETIHLSDLQQRILRLLDGTRDYKSIVSALVADVSKAELVIQEKGRPVTDSIGIQAAISRMLDENLLELAKHALLLG